MVVIRLYCGKIRHETEHRAYGHRRRLRRRNKLLGLTVPGAELSVYFCRRCQSWHVGHTKEGLLPPPS